MNPLILSIETATPVCSVALHSEGNLLGEFRLLRDKSHSGKLAVIIDQLVKNSGYSLSDLSAVALSEGPGSYTGLRIGASTAKGLCYGLNAKLIAINSLTAMAAQVKNYISENDLLVPMFDARRMEVYAQVLTKELKVIKDTAPVVIDHESFSDLLSTNSIFIFGDGAEKCKGVITHCNALFIDEITPSASTIGKLAFEKFLKNEFVDVAYFEPFYLKEYKAGTPKALV